MFQAAEQFQKMAQDYNKIMMDSWQTMTKQTIQSDAFAAYSGAMMDWSLSSQKLMTELSGQFMESLDIPKRSDMARLSAQIQSVESRILDQEDQRDDIRELLIDLVKKVDAVKAAQETVEAKAEAPKVKVEPKVEAEPKAKTVAKAAAKKKTPSRAKTKARAKSTRSKKAKV